MPLKPWEFALLVPNTRTEHNDRLGHQQRENKMNDWFKGLSKSQALGWIGICLLATAIVLVFVRRLLGTDIVL
jgi:hypothetical protein